MPRERKYAKTPEMLESKEVYDPNFRVPPAMKKKRSEKQQRFFLDVCEANWNAREFLQYPIPAKISNKQWETIIHNIAFNAVKFTDK